MNYKEPSSLVQIQIKQPFVLLFSNFLPCFHGNPPADKPRMEQEAKLGEGCEKGRESKGRIWLGRTKMPTFVPPQRGGNHRNNSAGHGRSWAGGGSRPKSRDGRKMGKVVLKTRSQDLQWVQNVLKMRQNEINLQGLSIRLPAGSAST